MNVMKIKIDFKRHRRILTAVGVLGALFLILMLLSLYLTFVITQTSTSMNVVNQQHSVLQTMDRLIDVIQQEKQDIFLNNKTMFNTTMINSNNNALLTSPLLNSTTQELNRSLNEFNQHLTQIYEFHHISWFFRLLGFNGSLLSNETASTETVWSNYKNSIKALQMTPLDASNNSFLLTNHKALSNQLSLKLNQLSANFKKISDFKLWVMRTLFVVFILGIIASLIYLGLFFKRQFIYYQNIVKTAKRQTTEVLNHLEEGFFLVNQQGRINDCISKSAEFILGRKVAAGDDFRRLMGDVVHPDYAEEVAKYLDLAFDVKVRSGLLAQFTTLEEVPIVDTYEHETELENTDGRSGPRFLKFKLRQIRPDADTILGVFVSVSEVTPLVNLRKTLNNIQADSKNNIDDVLSVLEQDPEALQDFLMIGKTRLTELSETLRMASKTPLTAASLIPTAATLVRNVKNESITLGLIAMAKQATAFEETLLAITHYKIITTELLNPALEELSSLQDQLARIERLFLKLNELADKKYNKDNNINDNTNDDKAANFSTYQDMIDGHYPSSPSMLNRNNTNNAISASFEDNANAFNEEFNLNPKTNIVDTTQEAKHYEHQNKPSLNTNHNVHKEKRKVQYPFSNVSLSEIRAEAPVLSPVTILMDTKLSPLDEMALHLEKLAITTGVSLNKKISMRMDIQDINLSPNLLNILREILPQLIRNSVVHGIETKTLREQYNKSLIGKIYLTIKKASNTIIEVSVQDDGRGITVETIKERLHQLNIDTSNINDSQILQYIFKPQFSTVDTISEYAGRGVGLTLVKQILEQAGASLAVNSKPNESTQFLMQFPSTL